jgi:hypothetical protein
MKQKIYPEVIAFGVEFTPDDVLYYTEKGIKNLGVFLGTKVFHMKKEQAIKQNALLKNMKYMESNIIHHHPHSGLRRTFLFSQQYNRNKPIIDLKNSIIRARMKRLKGGNR